MSNKIQNLAWNAPVPRAYKFVLVALADNANDEGVCYTLISTIMKKTSSSERTVQAAIRWLERTKCLTVVSRSGRSNVWKVHPDWYEPPQNLRESDAEESDETPAEFAPLDGETHDSEWLEMAPPQELRGSEAPRTPAESAPPANLAPSPAEFAAAPPQISHPPPQILHPESSLNLLRDPSLNPQNACAREAGGAEPDPAHRVLERVMPIYPRRAGRIDWATPAHHIGLRLQEGCSEDYLVERVTLYARYCDHEELTGTRHVMSPATFFSAADRPWAQAWDVSITPAERRERKAIGQLLARRAALGIAEFRAPHPGESSDQYRSAQDAEIERVKHARPADVVRGTVGELLERAAIGGSR